MQEQPKFKIEFVALMASLMSIVALSIDALLPALPEISASLGVNNINDNQFLITMIFLGIGFGNLSFVILLNTDQLFFHIGVKLS